MVDVFISYRQTDREQVVRLADHLKSQEFTVWFDAALKPGDAGGFDAEIEREVNSAASVLVCWTPDSSKSLYVRSEAKKGLERNCLVPIFLKRCELPVPFNDIQTIDFSAWDGSEDAPLYKELVKALSGNRERFKQDLTSRSAQSIREIESLSIPQYPGALAAMIPKLIRFESGPQRYWEMGLYGKDVQCCMDWLLGLLTEERDSLAEWHSEATQRIGSADDAWDYHIVSGDLGKNRRSDLAHLRTVLEQLLKVGDETSELYRRPS